MKKFLSILLVVMLVLSMLPATVSAAAPAEEVKYSFSSYAAGTQYAQGEEHTLDEYVKLTINGAHLNTQVRLYAGSNAVFTATEGLTIENIKLNAGNKAGTLNVYHSTDGISWTLLRGQTTTTSYTAYEFDIPSGNRYVKMESVGAQIRVSIATILYGENSGAVEAERTISVVENGATVFSETVTGDFEIPSTTVEAPAGWTFAGWVTEELDETQDEPAEIYAVGDTYSGSNEVTFYALYTRETEVEGVAGYVKKTSAITPGNYLIVYEADGFIFDSSLADPDIASNTKQVTIENGRINGTWSEQEVTIAAMTGGYSIQTSSGVYITGKDADTNDMLGKDSPALNMITIEANGDATIVGNGAYLRYNATKGQDRFRYFKATTYTSQKAIALYEPTAGGLVTVDVYTTAPVAIEEPKDFQGSNNKGYDTIEDALTDGVVKVLPAAGVEMSDKMDVTAGGIRYVTLGADAEGYYTYYPITLELTSVSLRSTAAGIYYTAKIDAADLLDTLDDEDEVSYGIMLSLDGKPADLATEKHTTTAGKPANNTAFLSGSVFNIFKDSADNNQERALMEIHATAYIKINGQLIISQKDVSWRFVEVLKAVNEVVPTLQAQAGNESKLTALGKFYTYWNGKGAINAEWALTNIAGLAG